MKLIQIIAKKADVSKDIFNFSVSLQAVMAARRSAEEGSGEEASGAVVCVPTDMVDIRDLVGKMGRHRGLSVGSTHGQAGLAGRCRRSQL